MLAVVCHSLFIYLNFKYHNNKKLILLTFIWLFVLFAFTNGGMDYHEYQWMFDNVESLNLFIGPESLFYISMYIIKLLGFNFTFFLIIFNLFGLILFYKVITYWTTNINFVLALFSLFPFINFIVQKRNFMAMMIVLYSIKFLQTNDKKGNLYFVLFILLASGFHSVSLFYLLLLPLVRINYLNLKKYFKWLIIPSYLFIIFLPNILKLMNVPEKLLNYFSYNSRMSLFSILFFIFWQTCVICLFYFYTKDNYTNDEKTVFLGDLFKKICFIFILTLPLYFYSSNFIRLIRNMIPLFYIFISCINIDFKNKKKRIMLLLSVLFLILTIIFELISSNGLTNLYIPIFDNNYLLTSIIL